jgi:hypothetical protein
VIDEHSVENSKVDRSPQITASDIDLSFEKSAPLLRFVFFSIYLLFCMFVILPEVVSLDIFLATLGFTSLVLWTGPLLLVGSKTIPFYDPQVFFNLACFYYVFKGFSLSVGEFPVYLDFLSERSIFDSYLLILFFLTVAIIFWNISYRLFMNKKHYINKQEDQGKQNFLGIGFLILISLIGGLFFFRSFNFNFLFLIENPQSRAYMADSSTSLGMDSSFAFILYYLMLLAPVASTVWYAMIVCKRIEFSVFWLIYTAACFVIIFVSSPRAALITFALSLFIVFAASKKRVSYFWMGTTMLIFLGYSYLVNIWRATMGSGGGKSLADGIVILSERAALDELWHRLLYGTDLSDVRIFVLIQNFYGDELPLKFGSTFLRIFSQFIPRFLWPNKPFDLGIEIGQLFSRDTLSGTPPGFFAEMYMNFSFPGVVLGGLFLGMLTAYLYKNWMLNPHNVTGLVLYSIVAPRLLLIPSSTIANLVTSLFIFCFGAVFALRLSAKIQNKTHFR